MTIQDKFYEKLQAEYNGYLSRLRSMPSQQIIDNAYEMVTKECILWKFNNGNYLTDAQAKHLLDQNYTLDDFYDVWKSTDIHYEELIKECINNHLDSLGILPGQIVEGEKIHGYTIKRAVLFNDDRGFAYAHNPSAVSPYVTWQLTNTDGKLDYYWGHYFSHEDDALADFNSRATEYAGKNGIEEKQLPTVQEKSTDDEWRKYKAEINNPDKSAFPNFEIFSAKNDVDAIREAHKICDNANDADVFLLEMHEVDDDYNIVRELDLLNHDPDLRRYMNVDLIDFLGQIADRVIVHYPSDFELDVEELREIAQLSNHRENRFMWHCSAFGTRLLPENDVFIRGTGSYNYWVDYRANDPDMVGYAIEVLGKRNSLANGNGETVIGNVYELGEYACHARYVREKALVLDSVSLTYSSDWGVNAGKTITVPRFEYDNDRLRLMGESGNVVKITYHPSESVKSMYELLKYEQDTRLAMPIGNTQEFLSNLDTKLAKVRNFPEQPTKDVTAVTHPSQSASPTFKQMLRDAQSKADRLNDDAAKDNTKPNTQEKKNNYEIGV